LKQNDVFEWFKQKYESGDKKFFSVSEVMIALKGRDIFDVRGKVIKLYAWGYLDIDIKEIWCRKYRIKEKYVNLKDVRVLSPLSKDLSFEEYKRLFKE